MTARNNYYEISRLIIKHIYEKISKQIDLQIYYFHITAAVAAKAINRRRYFYDDDNSNSLVTLCHISQLDN
jgi:hypothetical protein